MLHSSHRTLQLWRLNDRSDEHSPHIPISPAFILFWRELLGKYLRMSCTHLIRYSCSLSKMGRNFAIVRSTAVCLLTLCWAIAFIVCSISLRMSHFENSTYIYLYVSINARPSFAGLIVWLVLIANSLVKIVLMCSWIVLSVPIWFLSIRVMSSVSVK
jgi:hypothetical protein